MHDFITKTLDAKHNKSQGCYQWLWSGIPSFSGSLIASKKWAKKETHSYWQWCSQLNRNASYLSHFVLWQQKKAVWSISRYVHHAAHAIHCGSFIEKQLLWTGRITEWRKQSYHVRDRLRYCTAGSPIVNTSKFFFGSLCNPIKLPENEGMPDLSHLFHDQQTKVVFFAKENFKCLFNIMSQQKSRVIWNLLKEEFQLWYNTFFQNMRNARTRCSKAIFL